MITSDRDRYVREVLECYRATPGTRGRVRPADRRLAEELYSRGIPTDLVRAAMLLAVARRTFRDPILGPLEPIASLHYFLPLIEEIQHQPLDHGYLDYIQARLAAAGAGTPINHRSP